MLLKTVWVVFVFEQVGDIVSIIDMPPAHESSWWRGKNRFEVINAFNNFMMICCWHFIYIHTHPFNGPFFGTTQVSWYQKGKTNVDFTEARDGEWQWHQPVICRCAPHSRPITTPAPYHSVFTGQMPFLPPNQQRQSTDTLYT